MAPSLESPTTRVRPYHPCMHHEAHDRVARLHLPVAPRCTIRCIYCERRVGGRRGAGEACPGVAARLLSPAEAVAAAGAFLAEWGRLAVVGVAGPGDPLANPETFGTLAGVRAAHPDAQLCLCTNGLLLPERLPELLALGVQHLSITINAIAAPVVARLHPRILLDGQWVTGVPAARQLTARQLAGLEAAARGGMFVKVNSVLVPGHNETEIERVAREVAGRGATVFNLMPLIPRGALAESRPPGGCQLRALRARCAAHLPVFERCRQCRADARGIPGSEDHHEA
jgi:nitrogen fixation protein NifB